ncbi:acyltransferase family protein [Guptibacillus spartinae]|uniref:acyltransferase family protein n=1 Tax=Guptibacillus spartinae TaxID=3025679 RepID=UPI00235DD6F7|nr:acyltransferase [Pseudalkalibacillus spartinae]
MQKSNQGYKEIIFLSAITCLFLILVHVSELFFFGGKQSLNEISSIPYQLSQLGIAMFAVIVGLYLFKKSGNKKREKQLSSFEVSKVVLLFVLWSLFYLVLLKIVMNAQMFIGWKDSFVHIAMGNSFYHLFFISVVLQFLLIFPVLKLVHSKLGWSLLTIVSGVVHYYFLSTALTGGNEFLSQEGLLLKWIFFFIFGGLLARHWEGVQSLLNRFNQLGFVTLIGFIGYEVLYYFMYGSIFLQEWSLMITVPIIMMSLLGIYHSVRKVVLLDIFFQSIGENTVGLYFVYPLIIFTYSSILPDALWQKEYFVLVFTIVLGTSVFVSKAAKLFLFNISGVKSPFAKTKMMNQQELRIN